MGTANCQSDQYYHCYNNDDHNLRELPVATANPGDARVKVGSERQAATSPNSHNSASGEIGYTTIWNSPAGTLQNWRFHKEVCSDKGTRGYAGKAAKLLEGTLIVLEI